MQESPILVDLPEELVGVRVRLRPYRSGDGPALFEAVDSSREHLRPWLPWVDGHASVEDSEAFVRRFDARWRLREDLGVSIWERQTHRFLGGAGLHRIDWRVRRFEIGYWIRSDAQGQGYMTEAVEMLCELAIRGLGANRVIIRCAVDNARSAAIPKRLGFLCEGVLHNEGLDAAGAPFDMYLFAMTPEMWTSRNAT